MMSGNIFPPLNIFIKFLIKFFQFKGKKLKMKEIYSNFLQINRVKGGGGYF